MTGTMNLARTALFGAVAIALLAGAAAAEAQGVTVALTPASSQVAPGAIFMLEITVTQAGAAFNGFDTVISYDPGSLTLLPMSPISSQEGSLMTGACGTRFHQFHQGAATDTIVDVLLCNGVSVTGPGQIYRLRFQASMTPQITAVQFLSGPNFFDAGFRVTPVQATNALIGIGMPVAAETPPPPLGLNLRLAPNPSRGSAVFTIESETDGAARVTVVDVAGRLVRRFESAGAARSREIVWDGRDARGRAVPAGVYFVTVEAGGRSTTRPLSVVR